MPNPILQSCMPAMCDFDIKFLLKRLNVQKDNLAYRIENVNDSIAICERELENRR